MDLSALKQTFLRSSLAAAVLVLLLGSACSAGGSSLEDFTCNRADVPDRFFRQTEGSVTVGQIAALADDQADRQAELEAAGMVDGYFSYWSESLERPPFDPPIDLVCQSLLFEGSTLAQQYLDNLEAGPDAFATAALVSLPDSTVTAAEIPVPGGETRAFTLEAEGPDQQVRITALVWVQGRIVQSIYLGDNDGRATLDEARAVADALTARTARIDQPADQDVP